MASIYRRDNCYWIKFRDPRTKQEHRLSLETSYEGEAECKRRKIEHICALRRPEMTVTTLPEKVHNLLRGQSDHLLQNHEMDVVRPAPTSAPLALPEETSSEPEEERVPVKQALSEYYRYIRAENADATVQNKLSILRKFFGSYLIAEVTGVESHQRAQHHEPQFTGEWVQEMTPDLVQCFIEKNDLKPKTRKHYRELFHHLFEFMLRRHMIEARSFHTPNVMSILPNYADKNRVIVYLDDAQIDEQLELLKPFPNLRMAVIIMLEAGLRRAEALWLTKDAWSAGGEYLSVVNRLDPESDPEGCETESSLKTGARAVTVSAHLRAELEAYVPSVRGHWMLPSPKGHRWNKDNFSRKLRTINKAAGLTWGTLVYRHTFATRRAMKDRWSSVRIAREMGNSVTMVDRHYAGFLRPDHA